MQVGVRSDGPIIDPPTFDLLDISPLWRDHSSKDVRFFSVLAPVLLSLDIRPGDVIALRGALPGLAIDVPAIVAIAVDEDGDEALLLRYFIPPALLITKSTLMSEPVIQFPAGVRVVAWAPVGSKIHMIRTLRV
jgi:hypothetical protein